MNFDWKQFYLSGKGRVNRQQFWLRLVLPGFIISVVLMLIDLAIGTYDRQDGGRTVKWHFFAADPDPRHPDLHQALA